MPPPCGLCSEAPACFSVSWLPISAGHRERFLGREQTTLIVFSADHPLLACWRC